MVIPLFLGAIINMLFPQVLNIGGMTTATFKIGAGSFIGASLLCVGSQINITRVGEPLKRGFVLLIAKFLAGLAPAILVAKIWGPYGVLGLTPLMLIAAVTNSNGGMYLGLMAQFGDENDLQFPGARHRRLAHILYQLNPLPGFCDHPLKCGFVDVIM